MLCSALHALFGSTPLLVLTRRLSPRPSACSQRLRVRTRGPRAFGFPAGCLVRRNSAVENRKELRSPPRAAACPDPQKRVPPVSVRAVSPSPAYSLRDASYFNETSSLHRAPVVGQARDQLPERTVDQADRPSSRARGPVRPNAPRASPVLSCKDHSGVGLRRISIGRRRGVVIRCRQFDVSKNDPDLCGTEIRTEATTFTLPQTAHQLFLRSRRHQPLLHSQRHPSAFELDPRIDRYESPVRCPRDSKRPRQRQNVTFTPTMMMSERAELSL